MRLWEQTKRNSARHSLTWMILRTSPLLSFARLSFRTMSTAASASAPPQSTRPIVLCGPSGVGKSTLLKRLLAEFPGQYGFSVSR